MAARDAAPTPEVVTLGSEEDPPVAIAPGLSGELALADLHAKYHCEDGNLLRDDCGWECAFWEIATFVYSPIRAAERAAREAEIRDLKSRLGCVVEATYWDRPYDTRIDAIRGMCDLSTDGMTPASEVRGG